MSQLPIADYALLSDCRSSALVSRDGSIDWLCFPRFDSPSVFGRILDDAAGHWSIRPADGTPFESSRRYLDGSLLLETTFTTKDGSVVLTDALVVGLDERGHGIGADAVHAVMRRVVGIAGSVELALEYVPRPEYGLAIPALHPIEGGVIGRTATAALALSSSVLLDTVAGTASATFTLAPGQSASFALQYAEPSAPGPRLWTEAEIRDRLDDTTEAWRTWSMLHQNYQGPWAEPRPTQRPGAVRADVLPHRGDGGCAHDVASRGAGRLTQLGLPLRLGA